MHSTSNSALFSRTSQQINTTMLGYRGVFCWVFMLSLSGVTSLLWAHGNEKHGQAGDSAKQIVLAPGYEYLEHQAPEPGSYTLNKIRQAADGQVLDSTGEEHQLAELLSGKISILSFIYQACDDVNGCPLATYVMSKIRDRLSDDDAIQSKVQLLSMSFDPESDTPESMAAYAKSFGDSEVDWRFLTASNEEALEPILEGYGQSISRRKLDSGDTTINHVLRVYVIDAKLNIRNIYNSSLLHADSLISDIYTLAMEGESAAPSVAATRMQVAANPQPDDEHRLADDRTGYSSGDYVSRSRSVESQGQALDLYRHALSGSTGLPPLPNADQISAEKIALGRRLFFDRRLSINNTFSCAMCHIPEQAFTVNELSTAVGVEGRTVKRNAPSLLNVGFLDRLFHDGREFSLENQVWSPLLAHNEMANPSVGYVIRKIESVDGYAKQFAAAFVDSGVTMQSIGDALAAYQRSLIAGNSPFDRWLFKNEEASIPEAAIAGYKLFTGKAGCARCHTIGSEYALFTDQQMHNTGIGYKRSMDKRNKPHPVTLAPGVVLEIDPAVYADAAETPPNDLGLYEVTQDPDDRWKFRTPSLRNVALTEPYMHDGSLNSLEEVLSFYQSGGIPNPTLSPLMSAVELSEIERTQLIEFMQSLTSPDTAKLREDALAAPVGDL